MSLDVSRGREPPSRSDDRASAFRRRRRQLRRGDRARRRRPHGVHAARADRLRRAVLVLHHPDDARARRGACRSTTCCAKSSAWRRPVQGDRADRRPPRLVRPRSRPAVVADRPAARARSQRAGFEPSACSSASARSSRWTARARSSTSSPRPTASRRTFICRCSTRATACWRRCGGRTRSTYYAALVDDIRARIPHASIGSDIIVGFPGETDEDFEQLRRVPRALAADAPSRLPVLRSARDGGVGDARQGARRGRSRARPARPRDRSAADRAVPRIAGRHDRIAR